MVYLLSIGVVCLSALIGKRIAKIFILRDEFYKCINDLIEYFENNISYLQTPINDLFDAFLKNNDTNFKTEIMQLKMCVINNDNTTKMGDLKINFLKNDEWRALINFFNNIGVGNKNLELNNLLSFKMTIKKKSDECYEARKRNEGLIYKVSLFFGVIICILIF